MWDTRYYLKIIGTVVCSYFISLFLMDSLFVSGSITPEWGMAKYRVEELVSTSTQTIATEVQKIGELFTTSVKVEQIIPTEAPLPTLAPFAFVSNEIPSPIPTVVQPTAYIPPPTRPPYVPRRPTSTPRPVIPTRFTPSPTTRPLPTPTIKIPKKRPTKVPAVPTTPVSYPTSPPSTTGNTPLKVTGDPLKQTWYGAGSLACYTEERFIEVYANGVTPNTCRKNVEAAISSQLTSVTLLGTSITVHKKAYPAFKAVADELDRYKTGAHQYNFPSKPYTIKNVGAHVFRCNVNASSSKDVCSPNCKLSPHAFGIAVDINYDENCNGCTTFDMPKEISDTFELYGFRWGGHYPLIGSYIDPMHFEYMMQLCEGI